MGCNRMVGLSAGPRVAGGTASDCIWSIRIQNWSLHYMRNIRCTGMVGRKLTFFANVVIPLTPYTIDLTKTSYYLSHIVSYAIPLYL